MEGGWIKTERGVCEPPLEAIVAAGEMAGARFRGEAGAWLQQVGARVRGACRGDQGLLPSPGPGLRGVEVTQGHDVAYGMVRLEAPLLQLQVRGLCPRRKGEQPHAALVVAGLF